MQTLNLQSFTKLQLEAITVADRAFPEVRIITPHKGVVTIELEEKHYSFFGAVIVTNIGSSEIIKDILSIEEEAKEFLINEWLKLNKK